MGDKKQSTSTSTSKKEIHANNKERKRKKKKKTQHFINPTVASKSVLKTTNTKNTKK